MMNMRGIIFGLALLWALSAAGCAYGVKQVVHEFRPEPAATTRPPAPLRTLQWDGSGRQATQPFTVTESPWRVAWAAADGQAFSVWASDAATGKKRKLLANQIIRGDETAFTNVYLTGEFFLEISGQQPWAVTATFR